MKILLFKDFHKQDNSTKLPDITPPLPSSVINIDCKLKDNTSLTRPVVLISYNINTLSLYTFARIADFNRWYKVTDVVAVTNTICEVHLEVDVLGTYAGTIKSHSLFFERAPIANTSNGFFEDKYISTTYEIVARASWNGDYIPSGTYSSSGTFILGAVSSVPSNSIAGVAYYVLSAAQLKNVLDFIFDDGNFQNELQDAVNKTFFNPFQYIVSLKWLPFSQSAIVGSSPSTTNLKLGWWDTGVTATVVPVGSTVNFTTTTGRPSYTSYGDFRDMSDNFTRINMFVPSIGTIPISALDFNGDVNTPQLIHYVDIVTGDALIKLQYGTEHIASYNTHFSVDVPIGQQASTGLVSGVHDTINAFQATEKAPEIVKELTGAVKNVANTVVDVVSASIMPQPSVNGNQGNMSTYKALNKIIISIDKMGSGEKPSSTIGFPYYKYGLCNSIGNGFYKASGASIDIPHALASEVDQVNAYLNGGFFYES